VTKEEKEKGKNEEKEKKRRAETGGLTLEREITFVPEQETTRYKFSYLYRVRYPVQM
jgi:hypothetical protein